MTPKGAPWIQWPKAALYPFVGALLALGAPAGLMVLRGLLAGDLSPKAVSLDVAQDSVTYAYLTTSTMFAFIAFGLFIGRSADRLRLSATTDSLTGLANRRMCQERVVLELKRAARYGTALSLLLIDVDRLKEINDDHGHEAGDAALKRVAGALSASCRATDLAARWGGDEFTIVAPGTNAAEALRLAERVREALRNAGANSAAKTTVSIGITDVTSLESLVPEALYAAADTALYDAKAAGRDRAVVLSVARRTT
jgi:diguanylate cyclase (GGDEF)-like protein